MNEIFISHTSTDNTRAAEIVRWLRELHFEAVFLDVDPVQGIPVGVNWERELYQRLRACQAMLVLCSEASMQSDWCFAELVYARALGKPLIPVRLGPCQLRSPLDQVQAVDLTQNAADGYQRLARSLARLEPTSQFAWDPQRSPYPGLLAYEEEDAAVFFGRGVEIQQGLDMLRGLQQFGGPKLVLTLGASGSGKSSLVRAGLVPRLRRDTKAWVVVGPFRCRQRPFENLAEAWAAGGGTRKAPEVAQLLRKAADRPGHRLRVIRALLRDQLGTSDAPNALVVLVLDQLEELLAPDASEEGGRLLALLRAALEHEQTPFVLLATLRSDALETFQNQRDLKGLRFREMMVGPMAVQDVVHSIEGPAQVAGLALDPGLTGLLLKGAETEDALPLLAYTLRELWEQRNRETGGLSLAVYQQLDGLVGALRRAADQAYQSRSLTDAQKQLLEQAFVKMVRINEEGQYARRSRQWADLPSEAHGLLRPFVDRRLLVSGKQDGTIEVCHEAFLRQWPPLKGWLDSSREFLLWRRRLQAAREAYDRSRSLLREAALAEAEGWMRTRGPELEPAENELIRESLAQREREQARRRRSMIGLGIGLVVMTLLAGLTAFLWQQAEEATRRVTQQFDHKRLEDLTRPGLDLYARGPNHLQAMRDWITEAESLLSRETPYRADLRRLESKTSVATNSFAQFERVALRDIVDRLGQVKADLPRVRQRVEANEGLKVLNYGPVPDVALGSILEPGGVRFRVWAPYADRVAVAGAFNSWNPKSHELVKEPAGYWSATVPNAQGGDEYKYIVTRAGVEVWRCDPYSRSISPSGNSVVGLPRFEWQSGSFVPPPVNQLVLYEIHPGTFAGIQGKPVGGLDGVTTKLRYLADLGVTGIELMPVAEFPGPVSQGYNPAYPFAVERDYGGPAALARLVDQAHQLGLAVFLDVVYSHFEPADLGLWRFDGWSDAGHDGGIYFGAGNAGIVPWGARPDFGRPEVRQYLRDNLRAWLVDSRVDGLRVDATAWIRSLDGGENIETFMPSLPEGWTLLKCLNDQAHQLRPGKTMVAEDSSANLWLTAATDLGGAGFDAQWDLRFLFLIRSALTADAERSRDFSPIRDALLYSGASPLKRVIYLESHDTRDRLPVAIQQALATSHPGAPPVAFREDVRTLSALAAAVLFTTPGIPMIFQGQEFLAEQPFDDRTSLDWSKADGSQGVRELFHDLIHLRRNLDRNTAGLGGANIEFLRVDEAGETIAYHRWAESPKPRDSVVVMINFSRTPHSGYELRFPRPGVWRTRFNSASTRYGFSNVGSTQVSAASVHGTDPPFIGQLTIDSRSALILSQDD